MRVCGEKAIEGLSIALTNFSQHPTDRFVNEIVRVTHELLGDSQRVVELAGLDEVVGGDNRDPALPTHSRSGRADRAGAANA